MHWSRGNCFETVALKLLKWMIEWSPDLHLCDFTLFQFNHSLAQEWSEVVHRRESVIGATQKVEHGGVKCTMQVLQVLQVPFCRYQTAWINLVHLVPRFKRILFPAVKERLGNKVFVEVCLGDEDSDAALLCQENKMTAIPSTKVFVTHRALRGTSWSMAYSLHPEEDSPKMLNRSVKSVVSPSWLGSNPARRRLQQRFFRGWLRSNIYHLSFCENWDAAKASGISVLRDWQALIWRWVPASEPLDSFGRQRCFHDSKLSLHHRIGTMQSQFAWDLPNFATRNGWRHSHLRVVVKIAACRNLKGALLQGFLWRCYWSFKAQQSPLPKKRQRRCYISCRFFQCQWTPVACRTGALKQEDQHGWATGQKWK